MRKLVWAFVVRKLPMTGFLRSQSIYSQKPFLDLHLHPYFVYTSSEHSGKFAHFQANQDALFMIKHDKSTFEPGHEISNNVVCVTSKASDQPGHIRSLIRAFASRLNIQ